MAKSTFRPARILTPVFQGALVCHAFIAAIVGAAIAVSMYQQVVLPPGIFEIYQLIVRILAPWHWGVLLIQCFWIYRISANTHALASPKPESSPGWAVGWFFVPVASWFKPYIVVSELYNANRQPMGWNTLKRPAIVATWWWATVIGNILGLAVTYMNIAKTPSTPLSAALLLAIAFHQALGVVIYSRIARWQAKARSYDGVESVF